MAEKKTLHERVDEALANYHFDEQNTDINGLLAYAYYLGKCEGVIEVSNKAKEIFAEQKQRCEETRYRHLAKKIQGNINYIHHPDYDFWISMFSQDLTEC